MWYSVHTLNIENHSHIIGRQDGVTGDSIKANDDVVFCAACQSVFLKDSWKYMNGKHCQQSTTLKIVPAPTQMLIIRNGIKVTESIIFEFKNEFLYQLNKLLKVVAPFAMRHLFFLLASIVVILMWIFTPNDAFHREGDGFILFLSIIIFFVSHYFKPMWTKTKSEEIKNLDFINSNSELKILETGITIRSNFHYYNQIEKITTSKSEKEHKLIIELKDKRTLTKELPFRNYGRTKPFYLALAWAAQFVEIHFDTTDKKEYGLVKSIEKNYAGRIWVANNSVIS